MTHQVAAPSERPAIRALQSLIETGLSGACRYPDESPNPGLRPADATGAVSRFRGDPRSEARKPEDKTERLGQIATPPEIAGRLAASLLEQLRGPKVLDPCVGHHTFPEVLLASGPDPRAVELTCIDIDPEMVDRTLGWSIQNAVSCSVMLGDYLEMPMDATFDGAILNPPYVRQEWIDRKARYLKLFASRYGVRVPGTSNLYVYFLVKVLRDLRPGGAFSCIVYDSWQSTRFGHWLSDYMRRECSEFSVESVCETPFEGRLIDATIITGTRRPSGTPPVPSEPQLENARPGPFAGIPGFVPIADVTSARRGLRLKQADFFLTTLRDVTEKGATPFLKKVAKVPGFRVPEGHDEAALLVTDPAENPAAFEELQQRLDHAMALPDENVSILTWYRERPETWFQHRPAPYAPVVFNYYVRNRPRHIFNPRHRYADNFYGMALAADESPSMYLALMNSTAVCAEVLAHARNQGDGLAKIQLFEYRQVLVPSPQLLDGPTKESLRELGEELAGHPDLADDTIGEIDSVLYRAIGHPCLEPEAVQCKYAECDVAARRPRA